MRETDTRAHASRIHAAGVADCLVDFSSVVVRSIRIVQSFNSATIAPTAATTGARTAPSTPAVTGNSANRVILMFDDDPAHVALVDEFFEILEGAIPFRLDRFPARFLGHDVLLLHTMEQPRAAASRSIPHTSLVRMTCLL